MKEFTTLGGTDENRNWAEIGGFSVAVLMYTFIDNAFLDKKMIFGFQNGWGGYKLLEIK